MTTIHRHALVLTAALGLLSLGGKTAPETARQPRQQHPQAGQPVTLAGAHILIAYRGARRAKPSVMRSRAEALALARRVAALAANNPGQFAALARKHSDGPSAARGGELGSWRQGMMVPPFDAAVLRLAVGQVSAPVETVFGYHVILRKPLPRLLAGAHILIAYRGALRARGTIRRSKAQALARARHVAALARANPASFAVLARQYSDGPTASRGGDLGQWTQGRMVPAFDRAVVALKIGQVSGAVETPFGFHVIIRRAPRKP